MHTTQHENSLSALGEQGLAIYEARLKAMLEPSHDGEAVAIHVDTGDYAIGKSHSLAARELLTRHAKDGRIITLTIGPPTDADAAIPTYAERFGKTLPNTYDGYITGNRRTEISNAYQFACQRLKEENDKLVESEIDREHFIASNTKLASTAPYARRMQEMQRDIDLHRGTVDMLVKGIEDLRLKSNMTHDPVLVISPARHAQEISTSKWQFFLDSALIGLIAGLFAAGAQLLLHGPKRA